MQGADILVTTSHGEMPCFVTHPNGDGPFAPVIFYQDAGGMREELRNMARRIANAGYFCILPDQYYRLGQLRFDLSRRDEALSSVITACVTTLLRNPNHVIEDTAGILAYLDAHALVRPGAVGAAGHCIGGACAIEASIAFADRFAAAASFYGIALVVDRPDSPHHRFAPIKASLYFACPEIDRMTPHLPALRTALDKAGADYRLDYFAGASHGFCFPEKDVYRAADAEAAWSGMFDLFARRLR